ncbi:MAG: EAL domain-containing protein [Magnetococcales bacterium]|nr:EAL domain-containing protein [Magnetococcales bacterium]
MTLSLPCHPADLPVAGAIALHSPPRGLLTRQLLNLTNDPLFATGIDGRVTWVNAAFLAQTGYAWDQVLGRPIQSLVLSGHGDSGLAPAATLPLNDQPWTGEARMSDRLGKEVPGLLKLQPLADGTTGQCCGYTGVFRHCSPQGEMVRKLRKEVSKDLITGLPNRRLFKDRLKQAVRHARRTGEIIVTILLELEGLQECLNNFGLAAGEELTVQAAQRLKKVKRESDTLARWGEDRFGYLFLGLTATDQVVSLIGRLQEVLVRPFEVSGSEIRVSASMGVTIFPNDGEKPSQLIQNAAAALGKAKILGSGRMEFFEPAMSREMEVRLQKFIRLGQAVKNREFILHYQPKWNPAQARVTGFEALVRWDAGGGEPVLPGEFIPLAEKSGLIIPLGEWIIRAACRQIRRWLEDGMEDFTVAINLSPRQLNNPRLPGLVAEVMLETGVLPHYLEFEITEGVVMENPRTAIGLLERFRSLGIRVALDDFGTGYSSLSRLHQLPINTLKIDRSFVRNIHQDHKSMAIIQAIIALGQTYGLQVVAEGVENARQMEILSRAGCDELQGFFVGRPTDPDQACQAAPPLFHSSL